MYKAHCNICDCIMTDSMTPQYHTAHTIQRHEGIKLEIYVKREEPDKDHICIGCLRQILQGIDLRERDTIERPINAG